MKQNLIGRIFDVDLHSPITRSEVREIVKNKNEFINKRMSESNLTFQQALLDAGDIIDEFADSLDEGSRENFIKFYSDEAMAVEDNNFDIKKIEEQSEAESYHLQAQFIFNELSANLQVYGSNSALSGANPANVELALGYINRSLDLDPDNPVYLNLKGLLIWNGLGDKATAKTFIEKAARLDPRNITIQHNLKSLQDPNGCFIATAAYGTPLAYEVNELRYWRDTNLNRSLFGRTFIKTYYKVSPPIANLIKESPFAKKAIRILLKPLVRKVAYINKLNNRQE